MNCKNCHKETKNPVFCSKSCSVTFNNKNRKISNETKKEISIKLSKQYDHEQFIELYNSEKTITEISKIMNISRTTIYKIIKNNNLNRTINLDNNIVPSKINLNNLSIDELSLIVKKSSSIQEIVLTLGYSKQSGSTHTKIKNIIKDNNLDITHFNNITKFKRYKMSEILIEKSTYTNLHSLKNRLIKENYLTYECSDCKISDWWNNKPLILQLDHINGINSDNRIENLRFLCPNCHSQTPTYSGKNKK